MAKFLGGILTGFLLIVLLVILVGVILTSRSTKSPSITEGSTLILRLTGEIPEKPALDLDIPFLPQHDAVTVEGVWSILRHAAADPRIKAVIFEPQQTTLGWAKMQEIRADLELFRKSGKPLIAYLRAPGTREYYLASAASKIYMSPTDMLDLKGLALQTMYFKGSLDKLGVTVDVEHAGKYKDYGDMFTRTTMSPETREVMTGLADDLYNDLIATIAKGRSKDDETIKATLDSGPFLSSQAKTAGLVDDLLYEDQVFSSVQNTLHQKELKKVTTATYLGVTDSAAGLDAKDRIAWVVAAGSITRGTPGSSSANGLESEDFNKMLAKVASDSKVKGVIVRIDSPGGEVTASDEMLRAMVELRKKKPVVISMSDTAASGGYYMAMSGDPILAYPSTLTGSIGVVFGKPNLHGLYDKLGISKDSVSRGRFAMIESDYESLTEAGRQKLREGIDANYEDFIAKVARSRGKPVSVIEPLAQGRVWLGARAQANGLVDEIGGINRAIELVKAKASIPPASRVSLVIYPAKRSLLDLAFKSGSDSEADVMLHAAGLDALRSAWHDSSVQVWLRGGMLRMMPLTIDFR